jgi:hypothetical protein
MGYRASVEMNEHVSLNDGVTNVQELSDIGIRHDYDRFQRDSPVYYYII